MQARLLTGAAVLVAIVVSAGVATGAQRRAKPAVHTITIDATSFKPADLTIRVGDTVIWINKDVIPHTATNDAPKGFDSGTLAAGESWKRTFTAKETVDYRCLFHPTMKGRLQVK